MMKIKTIKARRKPIYAFVDSSNLFYGGIKSLGWKIDYKKLLEYLKDKYKVSKIFYYAGVEIYNFNYSTLDDKPIDLKKLYIFLKDKLKKEYQKLNEAEILILDRNIRKVKFYQKLEKFGYILKLKPVKTYKQEDGRLEKKANCDVDMTFDIMHLMEQYSGAVVLSGDGDFVIALKYLKKQKRKIVILARAGRTAKEIRGLAGGNFRDFEYLKYRLQMKEK